MNRATSHRINVAKEEWWLNKKIFVVIIEKKNCL